MLSILRLPFRPRLICIPLRLIERICPFGRMLAVPPPLRDSCRPGTGFIAAFVTLPLPALADEPLGLEFDVVPVGLPVEVPVEVLPIDEFVPGLPVVPDLPAVPVEAPGRVPVGPECAPVVGA